MATFIRGEFGDGDIECPDCGGKAVWHRFNFEDGVEEYRCDQGHVTEVPEIENKHGTKS